jgi:hypothetical protein
LDHRLIGPPVDWTTGCCRGMHAPTDIHVLRGCPGEPYMLGHAWRKLGSIPGLALRVPARALLALDKSSRPISAGPASLPAGCRHRVPPQPASPGAPGRRGGKRHGRRWACCAPAARRRHRRRRRQAGELAGLQPRLSHLASPPIRSRSAYGMVAAAVRAMMPAASQGCCFLPNSEACGA